MEHQILALIVLLVGFGVMLGGVAFVRRIFAVLSGCLQALIGLAIAFVVLLFLIQASCSSLVGRAQRTSAADRMFCDRPHLVEGQGAA